MRKVVKCFKQKGLVGMVNAMALSIVVLNAQQCCFWMWHQPEFPVEADKYRKFK